MTVAGFRLVNSVTRFPRLRCPPRFSQSLARSLQKVRLADSAIVGAAGAGAGAEVGAGAGAAVGAGAGAGGVVGAGAGATGAAVGAGAGAGSSSLVQAAARIDSVSIAVKSTANLASGVRIS